MTITSWAACKSAPRVSETMEDIRGRKNLTPVALFFRSTFQPSRRPAKTAHQEKAK
jgi:hypothetical protein